MTDMSRQIDVDLFVVRKIEIRELTVVEIAQVAGGSPMPGPTMPTAPNPTITTSPATPFPTTIPTVPNTTFTTPTISNTPTVPQPPTVPDHVEMIDQVGGESF